MKLNNILLAALAAGMFASCSDEPKTDTPTEGAAQGDGYLAVTIKLPTEKGNSRAANDNFDDGLASEYAVNDMWLVLFEGSSDADAKFNAAYKIDLPTKVGDVDNDNITTSYLTAVKVNKVEGGLMGLVMVNAQNIITVTDGALTVDGKPFTGTFAELNKIASDKPLYADGNFFMTNAPLSTVAGGKTQPSADNVQILVNLSNSLYTTEQEAKDNPAGSVYVERAVAKATLSANAATATIGGNNVEVSDIQWRLDNTEPTSYIVHRRMDGLQERRPRLPLRRHCPDGYHFHPARRAPLPYLLVRRPQLQHPVSRAHNRRNQHRRLRCSRHHPALLPREHLHRS